MARRGNSRTTRRAIGAIGLLVFTGYLLWALQAEEKIRVVSKKLERTNAGVVVSGEVYNAASTPTSVKVEVTFFNSSGRKLAEDVVDLPNLPVGASTSFRTQPQQLSDVQDYSLYVNAGRNMYGN
jgi:hypothetical protein